MDMPKTKTKQVSAHVGDLTQVQLPERDSWNIILSPATEEIRLINRLIFTNVFVLFIP